MLKLQGAPFADPTLVLILARDVAAALLHLHRYAASCSVCCSVSWAPAAGRVMQACAWFNMAAVTSSA